MRKLLILALFTAMPAAALVAAAPVGLAQIGGGLWEVSGGPGGVVRQCMPDALMLAQFEHRSRSCRRIVVSEKPGSVIVSYNCGTGDFGRSQMDVITPRSLRISTQGISDQLPFNYVLQARRIGECGNSATAQRH